jgi:hypothetical protein
VDQAALHERAVPLASEAAQFPRALDHAHAAAAIYADRGDRLGVVRAKAHEAFVLLSEHQDQTAIALLRDGLADTADLGPSADIAHAQAELGRALMLAGQEQESIEWCDRVLDAPEVAAPEVVLEAAITKGTALQNAGRDLEGQIILRGAALVADSMGSLYTAIRARNNLRVQLQLIDLRAALELNRELYEIARKFGQRTWLLHSAAGSADIAFRMGDWESYIDEARAEHADASGYYASWFKVGESMREIFRGDAAAAEVTLKQLLAAESTVASQQAITWESSALAEAQLAQGRFDDAFATAAEAWSHSAEADRAHVAGLFAAAGAGDAANVETARAAWRAAGARQLPLYLALERMADAFVAAIEGRWNDAHAAYLAAASALEEVGEAVILARLQLALAHLSGDQLPEVVAKVPEAEAFFAERGASAWVAAYRAAAWRPRKQPAASDGASLSDVAKPREAVGGSSGSVRSTG